MNDRTERELYERQRRREVEISRNNASASSALLLGVFAATIATLCVVFFALSRQNQTQAPTVKPPDIKINVPQPQAPQVQPPDVNVQPPDVNIQQPDVNVPEVNVPDVNVTVPKPEVPTLKDGDSQQAPTQTPSP